MHKVTMSARGQLVIPAEIRKNLGLKGGTRLRLYNSQGKLVLVPEVEDPVESGLGFLRLPPDHTGSGEARGEEGANRLA